MEFHAFDAASIKGAVFDNVSSMATSLLALFVLFPLIGGVVYALRARSRAEPRSVKGVLAYLFPARIYLHRSAIIDYVYLPLRAAVQVLFTLTITVGTSLSFLAWLREHAGTFSTVPQGWIAFGLQFLLIWLTTEFASYINHYIFHKIPFLWRFHRAHHSAEALTPVTAFRFHPVEMFLSMMVTGVGGGLLTGTVLYASGLPSHPEDVALVAFILSIMHVLLEPFYHSHIWISFGDRLNRIFLAPCHHHVHHSAVRDHWDKNLGDRIALWDRLFGTLYIPRPDEDYPFGINAEEMGDRTPHANLGRWLVEPVITAGRMAAGSLRRNAKP